MHRPLSAFARIPKRHIRGPSANAQCVAQSSTEGKMCTGLARLRVAPSCSVHYASPGPAAVHCGPLRHCHTDRAEPVHGRTDGRTGIKRPTNRPIGTIYVRDRRPQPVNDCRLQDYGERKCADTVGTVLVPLAAWRIAAFVA